MFQSSEMCIVSSEGSRQYALVCVLYSSSRHAALGACDVDPLSPHFPAGPGAAILSAFSVLEPRA